MNAGTTVVWYSANVVRWEIQIDKLDVVATGRRSMFTPSITCTTIALVQYTPNLKLQMFVWPGGEVESISTCTAEPAALVSVPGLSTRGPDAFPPPSTSTSCESRSSRSSRCISA